MTIEKTWYWDRRTRKAYFPVSQDEDTVALVSIWHGEEVESAIETDAMVNVSEIGDDNQGFDHFESFRLPDEDELDRRIEGSDD